jgi:hypothetical protein
MLAVFAIFVSVILITPCTIAVRCTLYSDSFKATINPTVIYSKECYFSVLCSNVYVLYFDAEDVTSPISVLGRCLALLGCPLKSDRGTYILQFLGNYTSNVSRHLKPLWEKKIPELVSHIDSE